MNVDIYIKTKDNREKVRIPLLPEEITLKMGDGMFATYDIMGKGEAAIPTGVGLSAISWESEFPGANWPCRSMLRDHMIRDYYISIINKWRRYRTPLNIIVTSNNINLDVYVSKFTTKAAGPFGNIAYEIEFVECKDIVVKTSVVKKSTSGSSSSVKRGVSVIQKHTVKNGDTCWRLSLKYYKTGTKWKKIYEANKTIIEKTAKKHGRSDSENGWWIYPGTVLTIPAEY